MDRNCDGVSRGPILNQTLEARIGPGRRRSNSVTCCGDTVLSGHGLPTTLVLQPDGKKSLMSAASLLYVG